MKKESESINNQDIYKRMEKSKTKMKRKGSFKV